MRYVAIAVAAALGAWAFWEWSWTPVQCNDRVSRLMAQTDAAERTTGEYARLVRARRNLEELAALRERCPREVRVPVLIGANEELVGRLNDAAASYSEALRIEQRPEIYAALATAQVQLGLVDQAVENYVLAARFHPLTLESIQSEELHRRINARLAQPR
jgi:tetratricopeptide (TPR) repeat protein